MKKPVDTYITVGKFGAPYGIHGWLKIQPYTEFHDAILQYHPWYISEQSLADRDIADKDFTDHQSNQNEVEIKQKWRAISFEKGQVNNNQVMVKLPQINTPEAARAFTGLLIAITRSQLPPLKNNEYYWSDLVGLTVVNTKGEVYGKVIYLISTGANDVLVVKNKKEHAIPYLFGDVILRVDLINQQIDVDWELI